MQKRCDFQPLSNMRPLRANWLIRFKVTRQKDAEFRQLSTLDMFPPRSSIHSRRCYIPLSP
ncbi:hypothetical protein B0G69_8097 [Paraburkholderia sp. RAU2J]|nr:hypothetical protein B0G69_8097 [Paraburkholderia sp. RAU2J]